MRRLHYVVQSSRADYLHTHMVLANADKWLPDVVVNAIDNIPIFDIGDHACIFQH